MIPWAMNRDVKFEKEQGPILNPMVPDITKIEKKLIYFNYLDQLMMLCIS